jgi:hypothetical protein
MQNLVATKKQQKIIDAALSARFTRILVGGAVAGAKTVGCLMVIFILCRIFPGIRVCIVRKDRPTMLKTVVKSFWKFAPQPFFNPRNFNKQELLIRARNGSEVQFIAENFKQDKVLSAFDGLEVNVIFLEQVEELSKDLYLKCCDRVGRWAVDPRPRPLIIMSCNPHQGWVKEFFYNPYKAHNLPEGQIFIPALPKDNPYNSEDYLQSLEELKLRSPNLYRKRVLGSWEADDVVDQLISWDHLWKAERKIGLPKRIKLYQKRKAEEMNKKPEDFPLEIYRGMGVDVGRNGPDPSKWYVLEGHPQVGFNVIHSEGYDKTNAMQVEQKTKELIKKYELSHSRVYMDVVGLGGMCVDHLHNDGYWVKEFNGGGKTVKQFAAKDFEFKNLNSQVSWNVKLYFEDSKVGAVKSDKLRGDLAAYTYDIAGEKTIKVCSKDDVKAKISRSPDDADAFKMALWAVISDKVRPIPGVVFV